MDDDAAPTSDVLVAACRRLGEAMDVFDERAAAVLGVGRSDLRALNLLEDGPLSAGEVAHRLRLTSGSVTALVDRLVAAGYVTRDADPANRRRVAIALRPATYRAFAAVYRPLGERVREATSTLEPEQRVLAAEALDRMVGAFDAVTGRERPPSG